MVELLFQPEVKPDGQLDATQHEKGQPNTTTADSRKSIAAEKARYFKSGAALIEKGTIPAVELGGTTGSAAPDNRIDTSGPGWSRHQGAHPGDNYYVKNTGNHQYQKVYADGTVEEVIAEGDEGSVGKLDKTIKYPSGNERVTVMDVDANGKWTEEPTGYMKDKSGVEHHWGPKPEDTYLYASKDQNHSMKIYVDGSTDVSTTKVDPKTHEQTRLLIHTNQAGEVTRQEQYYQDGTSIITTPDRIELSGRDREGNLIDISKTHHGQPEVKLTNHQDGKTAAIGKEEIPQTLKSRYEQQVAPF